MLDEFCKVKIKSKGLTGVIVDIYKAGGKAKYTVESDEKGVTGGYGDEDSWKLFECEEDDLEELH